MRTLADIALEAALYELRPACRIASDRIDKITPVSRAADKEAACWIANWVEVSARDAECNGAPTGLAEAGRAFADAAERLDTWASVQEAHEASHAVKVAVAAALASYGLPDPRHASMTVPPAG